jgi:hypothetical protein
MNTKKRIPRAILSMAAIVVFAITACPQQLQTPNWQTIGFDAIGRTLYGKPDNTDGGGVYFDFPVEDGNQTHVNYLRYAHNGPVSGSLVVTFEVSTTGYPAFNFVFEPGNTCTSPATTRLYIERRGFSNPAVWGDLSWGPNGNPNYRWWSNPLSFTLVGGSRIQLTVPLTPDQWSNVNGQMGNTDTVTLRGFQAAIADVQNLGFSFGGGCSFGHGINVTNCTARFTVISYAPVRAPTTDRTPTADPSTDADECVDSTSTKRKCSSAALSRQDSQ